MFETADEVIVEYWRGCRRLRGWRWWWREWRGCDRRDILIFFTFLPPLLILFRGGGRKCHHSHWTKHGIPVLEIFRLLLLRALMSEERIAGAEWEGCVESLIANVDAYRLLSIVPGMIITIQALVTVSTFCGGVPLAFGIGEMNIIFVCIMVLVLTGLRGVNVVEERLKLRLYPLLTLFFCLRYRFLQGGSTTLSLLYKFVLELLYLGVELFLHFAHLELQPSLL
mmetsp:Transcript_25296/g.60922  ORF Transcript_25296/g.60922 Transcript_25296/m.60922 type:complete len:225 (-) Transcript_25296:1205-1879(-)